MTWRVFLWCNNYNPLFRFNWTVNSVKSTTVHSPAGRRNVQENYDKRAEEYTIEKELWFLGFAQRQVRISSEKHKIWRGGNSKVLQVLIKSIRYIYLKYLIAFQRNFKFKCPDGKLYKADVQKMYEKILPNTSSAKLFVDNIFRIFDADCDGHITFTVR